MKLEKLSNTNMQNQKPKICHFTSAHPSDDVRIFHKECVSLAEAGFEVYLVAANTTDRMEKGVHIVNAPSEATGRFSRMWKTTKAVYQKAKELDADIYHFHDPELLPYAWKLKRKGKKVIYDAHEDLPKQILGKYWINKYLRKSASFSFRKFEDFIAKRLDYILTATPFICDRFSKVNPNSLDINNFPLLSELTELTSWEEKNQSICYTGGLTQIRGLEQIVEAMEYIPNTTLHIAGKYSPASFQEVLQSKTGWKNVQEHGFVSRQETNQIMANAKVGLVTFLPLPNHVDAQPNKMFEYMSAGIPVVGSFFPLWKEIILTNACGLCVNPENPKEIAQAVNHLLDHPEEAKEMGLRGRKQVLEKYNWDAEAKKLIGVYQVLLEKKN